MKLYILKSLLKGKQKRIMLVVELFFSFIAFFLVLSIMTRGINNARISLGFDYTNLYKVDWDITAKNNERETMGENVNNIKKYINTYPGVINSGECYSSFFFINGYMNPHKPFLGNNIAIPGGQVNQMLAGDELAEILDLEILTGRWFAIEDNAAKNRPVVLTKNLKERMFGNSNALGEIVNYCGQQCKVVGICNNLKHKGDYTKPDYTLFIRNISEKENLQYETWMCMSGSNCGESFFMKCHADLPGSFFPDLVRKVAVNYPGYNLKIKPMQEIRQDYIRRTWAPLIAVLSIIMVLFINVLFGLFGVLWYNISQRKSEIGLRIAAGANKGHIYRQFIEEMLLLATLAIVPGILIAMQISIFDLFNMATHVYVIAMLIAAFIIYMLVTLCALLPAAQAVKIQPAIALYEE